MLNYTNDAAFIVRIWLEPRESKEIAPQLRGSIEHVVYGQQQYFTELQYIIGFIEIYQRLLEQKYRIAASEQNHD